MLDYANSGHPILMLLLLLLRLLLLSMLTPLPVCGYVASGLRWLLNTRKMVMVK